MKPADASLRAAEQQVRGIVFPEVEKDLYVPDKLKKALAKLGLEVAQEFIPLVRRQNDHTTDVIIRRLERKLTVEQRCQLAQAIPHHFRKNNPSLKAVWERWGPPTPRPSKAPTIKARQRGLWVSAQQARKYGLSQPAAVALLREQGFRCAICRVWFESAKGVCMDHNHATGSFRAFLCGSCNTGLGLFADCPARLQAAVEYLAHHGHYGPGRLA